MAKNMTKGNAINIPKPTLSSPQKQILQLPFAGKIIESNMYSYSFSCFDRNHSLFNLGDTTSDGVVSGKWFLDFLDCLKDVSSKTISEMKNSMHDLHPIDWKHANANPPLNSEQYEYWQFRINKSKGRIIGFPLKEIFYIVWLDPHHNLTDSDGYGKAVKYYQPLSLYEKNEQEFQELNLENKRLREELETAYELLDKS